MTDAVERLVNLALYLADARAPVALSHIRADVAGYSDDQDEIAFLRMFERDKEALRDAGFAIEADEGGRYWLDRSATFSAGVELSAEEAAAIRAAGTAMLSDPSFPFAADLRLALAKVSSGLAAGEVPAAGRLADEDPGRQGAIVAELADAAARCKQVAFTYTNSYGATAPHAVEPYGLFLHDGRWYAVGRDIAKDQARTYTVARMSNVSVNGQRPKSPDFERPADFDVKSFVRLPFQYGSDEHDTEAALRFDASAAWRAESVTAGEGLLERDGSGALWSVRLCSRERFLRFAIESGPGVHVFGPEDLVGELHDGLEAVIRAHG